MVYERRYSFNHDTNYCPCGSRISCKAVYDARNIFVFFSCEKCDEDKRKKYRPEIFTDRNYWHDEPIDEE